MPAQNDQRIQWFTKVYAFNSGLVDWQSQSHTGHSVEFMMLQRSCRAPPVPGARASAAWRGSRAPSAPPAAHSASAAPPADAATPAQRATHQTPDPPGKCCFLSFGCKSIALHFHYAEIIRVKTQRAGVDIQSVIHFNSQPAQLGLPRPDRMTLRSPVIITIRPHTTYADPPRRLPPMHEGSHTLKRLKYSATQKMWEVGGPEREAAPGQPAWVRWHRGAF
jgi:hypothetical protein